MSVPHWPSYLPKPNREGFGRAPQDGRRRRRAEAGPPGYAKRFSATARLVNLTISTDRQGKAVFEKFFDEDTEEGSLPFWMPDPTTDGWPLLTSDGVPLLIAGGVPLLLSAQWLCLFGDQLWSEQVIGVRFQISFQVAVMP